MRNSAVRIAVAVFLASTAAGCSSDASRFTGLFSDKDSLTTASIPQRQGGGAYGLAPIPEENIGSAPGSDYLSRSGAVSQPYPAANSGGYASGGYQPVAPASPSPARASASIQRAELAPPSAASQSAASLPPARDLQSRNEALAQPMPAKVPEATASVRRPPTVNADGVVTGSTGSKGWSVTNAPKVTLKPGETAATLSNRYGVPEKEILRANGGSITAGQIVIIPTYSQGTNAAKLAAGAIDLQNPGKLPVPSQQPGDKVAVLPTPAGARDKMQAEAGKLTPPAGGKPVPPSGGYVVKSGDTLSKIAKATNTPIDRLKAENGITDGNLRIGQTLKVAGTSGDDLKTASIPAAATQKPAAAPKAEQVALKPDAPAAKAPEKPAAAQTASLSDVEQKSDMSTPAPTSTGISKYRWPVTGAVIASYGQNVNGSRNDGIDISVPEGTPIKAAENGVVIYAGNGLKQLGNTVLVRHDDGKVTVYGHAANISVTRGQKIQRGQTVATSGMSGDAKRPQVHFEVRKDATPVNPITFLE
ncbi:LysM peptidoglycan-binding domain-containing M23 family metallopeptidase [Rhizobium sp. FY34]|uniref:LysM peptidoglycan-binding domain-containing M23 family metallopeptidase n=1 Tax=Rhizobium sp. FY34 TaxID=2562309 RepID=UPI001FEEE2E8|nr:LysM peptidoglycan-binding domain-containing M23 family metallopeptidase [Rhizobium sp. FY34]